MTLHEDEIKIDLPLVRALVDRALPDLAGHPLRRLDASGSSNVLYRLGDDLLVRLPRQPGGSETITKEARWLPYVAPALPVEVPTIVAVGEPDLGYPEQWSVVRWLDGELGDAPVGPAAAAHGSPVTWPMLSARWVSLPCLPMHWLTQRCAGTAVSHSGLWTPP